MRVLGRLLWIIFSLVMISAAISFTVSNDEFIALALWPFPQKLTMPAWLSVISAFLIGGILVGGLMWGQCWRFAQSCGSLNQKFENYRRRPHRKYNTAMKKVCYHQLIKDNKKTDDVLISMQGSLRVLSLCVGADRKP